MMVVHMLLGFDLAKVVLVDGTVLYHVAVDCLNGF